MPKAIFAHVALQLQTLPADSDAVVELNVFTVQLTDYSITGGFSPHILFRGFLLPTRSQIKHNTLHGLFTITIKKYYIAVLERGFNSLFFSNKLFATFKGCGSETLSSLAYAVHYVFNYMLWALNRSTVVTRSMYITTN